MFSRSATSSALRTRVSRASARNARPTPRTPRASSRGSRSGSSAAASWSRPGPLDHRRVRRLQRLHRLQRLLAVEQARVQRRLAVAARGQLARPSSFTPSSAFLIACVSSLCRYSTYAAAYALTRRISQLRIVVSDLERQHVRVRRGRHARLREELRPASSRLPGTRRSTPPATSETRATCGLRLRDPVGSQRDARRLRSGQFGGKVLRTEQNAGGRLVERLLAKREDDRQRRAASTMAASANHLRAAHHAEVMPGGGVGPGRRRSFGPSNVRDRLFVQPFVRKSGVGQYALGPFNTGRKRTHFRARYQSSAPL